FCHPNLLALEISNISSNDWFTDRDDIQERKNLIAKRRTKLNEEESYEIAKTMASDAHMLSKLGTNATGNKRLTRIKIDTLTFDSFKIAFIDSVARIRLEDLIPNSVPKFIGVRFDGGFLDSQVINFSNNLTCIIGGRGAG